MGASCRSSEISMPMPVGSQRPGDAEAFLGGLWVPTFAWNSRNPERVALAYTEDSEWRNRTKFFFGRAAIIEFLIHKWSRELDYRLRKELWAFEGNRIEVRFEYEFHDAVGAWYRAYRKMREFTESGHIRRRFGSINDFPVTEGERKFRWER